MVNGVAEKTPHRFKFVDDITIASHTAVSSLGADPVQHPLQDVMQNIGKTALDDRMTVNTSKCATMLVCASDKQRPKFLPLSFGPDYIQQVSNMKLLGVTLQDNLKWDTHVLNMVGKANSRKYFILVLKRLGVGLSDLVKCYCVFVRPLLEYAVPVWHSGLTNQQSLSLERVQKQTLRILLPDATYRQACSITGLERLDVRRVELCRRFALNLLRSGSFSHWLPPRRRDCHQRHLRNSNKLSVLPSRTKRFTKSPVAFMTSLLNQQQ